MFLKTDDLLVISAIKVVFHFCTNWAQKTNFLEVLPIFFRTIGLQHKLLILIEYPNIFHWKSAKKRKVGLVFGATCGPN